MRIGFIGTGTMGQMLIRACFRYGSAMQHVVYASNNSPAALHELHDDHPLLITATNAELVAACDVIFVCVPPQVYLSVVDEVAPLFTSEKLLVCISNGVSLNKLGARVNARIVKAIPSIAHKLARGVSLIMAGPRAQAADVDKVIAFFQPFSKPVLIPPEACRAATNITGCGPALLATFCMELANASALSVTEPALHGIFQEMTNETLKATAALLEDGTSLDSIIKEACTGGGMTQTAVETLRRQLPIVLQEMTANTIEREAALRDEKA